MVQVRETGQVRGGVGLAAERLGHGPDVLVTTASDHVVLRTPTRPDHFSGNAIHLFAPPDAVLPWLQRHADSVGRLPGVDGAFLCWELSTDVVAGASDRAAIAAPDAASDPGAAGDAGAGGDIGAAGDTGAAGDGRLRPYLPADVPADATVEAVSALVWRPDLPVADVAARSAALESVAVRDPGALDIRSGADEHVMAGARALYLQAGWGTDVDYWRWHVAQQRDLMVAGRCDVWVAYAMGIPACRASLMHDRRGLAIIEDVVTHPLHRGKGLASALVVHALRHHLAARPHDLVVIRASAHGPARRLYERLGFVTVATDISLRTRASAGRR